MDIDNITENIKDQEAGDGNKGREYKHSPILISINDTRYTL